MILIGEILIMAHKLWNTITLSSEYAAINAAHAAYEAASCDDFFEDHFFQINLRECEKDTDYNSWCGEMLCEDRGTKAQMAFEWVK